jgi:AbrB family looped-hinge helix DNA binding protein
MPISQKGQVTIPAEIRDLLGLEKNSQALLRVENEKVILKSPKYSLEDVYGSIKPIKKPFKEIRKIAREERIKKSQ